MTIQKKNEPFTQHLYAGNDYRYIPLEFIDQLLNVYSKNNQNKKNNRHLKLFLFVTKLIYYLSVFLSAHMFLF